MKEVWDKKLRVSSYWNFQFTTLGLTVNKISSRFNTFSYSLCDDDDIFKLAMYTRIYIIYILRLFIYLCIKACCFGIKNNFLSLAACARNHSYLFIPFYSTTGSSKARLAYSLCERLHILITIAYYNKITKRNIYVD